jgi:hypothetical protein
MDHSRRQVSSIKELSGSNETFREVWDSRASLGGMQDRIVIEIPGTHLSGIVNFFGERHR